jgi:hypothetical protein
LMMYKKSVTKELLTPYGDFDNFFKIACENISQSSYPTEQDTYANWCLKHHAGMYYIKNEVPTVFNGKTYPANYTENEVGQTLKGDFGDAVSVSLHTWGD